MKLAGVSIVSIFALLFAGVVEACPTLKATGKKYVVGGKSTYYKVRVSTGTTALADAALTITLPDGVKLDLSTAWPKRAAPSQSGADVTWTGLSLAARKHYTFRMKVDVDACAPDELDFEANVSGGSCDVDATTVTTTVKRAKGAKPCPPPPPPPPAGACTAAGTIEGKAVYNCGSYDADCGGPLISGSFTNIEECVTGCLVTSSDYYYVAFVERAGLIGSCTCMVKNSYEAGGVVFNAGAIGYVIGENPATLNIKDFCD